MRDEYFVLDLTDGVIIAGCSTMSEAGKIADRRRTRKPKNEVVVTRRA